MIAHAGSASLRVTDIKTANYAAEPGELVQCDASGGSFTIGLPANPGVNDRIGVKLLEATGSNSVTVGRNGNAIEGEAGDLVLSAAGDYHELQYDGAGQWLALSESAPPSATVRFQPPNGRLTLTSGTPIMSGNVTGASTIYFTPYEGNTVYLFDGDAWLHHDLNEVSLALSGLTSGKNYDVFLYSNGGTPAMELSAPWVNDSTRSDALATQDGVPVKSGAPSRLHIGTIRTTGTNTTEFSFIEGTGPKRAFVWNRYNRVLVPITASDTAGTYNYTTAVFRKARNSDNSKVEFILGAFRDEVRIDAIHRSFNASGAFRVTGVGLNTASAPTSDRSLTSVSAGTTMPSHASRQLAAGYHFAHVLEYSQAVGTTTWNEPTILEVHLWC